MSKIDPTESRKRGRPRKNRQGLASVAKTYRLDPDVIAVLEQYDYSGEVRNQTQLIEAAVKRYVGKRAK